MTMANAVRMSFALGVIFHSSRDGCAHPSHKRGCRNSCRNSCRNIRSPERSYFFLSAEPFWDSSDETGASEVTLLSTISSSCQPKPKAKVPPTKAKSCNACSCLLMPVLKLCHPTIQRGFLESIFHSGCTRFMSAEKICERK